MIGRPEYTLTLPPPCPTNRDHLNQPLLSGRWKWLNFFGKYELFFVCSAYYQPQLRGRRERLQFFQK